MSEDLDLPPLPECREGPEAYERFDATMSALLSVPKSLVLRRQKAYRKKVDANPNRRGPKRKGEIQDTPERAD
jgi:hypothetical protein